MTFDVPQTSLKICLICETFFLISYPKQICPDKSKKSIELHHLSLTSSLSYVIYSECIQLAVECKAFRLGNCIYSVWYYYYRLVKINISQIFGSSESSRFSVNFFIFVD